MKVNDQNSLEPSLGYNQNQTQSSIKVRFDLSNHLESYRNIMQFWISIRRKNGLLDT